MWSCHGFISLKEPNKIYFINKCCMCCPVNKLWGGRISIYVQFLISWTMEVSNIFNWNFACLILDFLRWE